MNNHVKKYILDHYSDYGIMNEHNKPITQSEMLGLLNILEANQETLESFHDVAFNGLNEFCCIYGDYETDSDTYEALIAHHLFLNDNEFIDYMLEKIQEYTEDGSTDVVDWFKNFEDDSIYKTSDGYVIRFDY